MPKFPTSGHSYPLHVAQKIRQTWVATRGAAGKEKGDEEEKRVNHQVKIEEMRNEKRLAASI